MQFLSKHTWIIVLTAVMVSFLVPSIGKGIQPFVSYLLMILMFMSLLTISVRDVVKELKHVREIVSMLAIIHLLGPALVLIFFSRIFPPEIVMGLFLVSTIPSGVSVVFLSKLFGGDPSKALPITAISNLASPLIVPAVLLLFTSEKLFIPVDNMVISMAKLVILPYIVAMIIRRTPIYSLGKRVATPFSQILLFILIIGIVSPLVAIIIQNIGMVIALSIASIMFVLVSFWISVHVGKTLKDRVTFGITGSFKNFTLATVIALTVFSPYAALPAVVFSLVNNLMLIPLELILQRYHR